MLGKRQAAVNAGAVVDVDLVGRSALATPGGARDRPLVSSFQRLRSPCFPPCFSLLFVFGEIYVSPSILWAIARFVLNRLPVFLGKSPCFPVKNRAKNLLQPPLTCRNACRLGCAKQMCSMAWRARASQCQCGCERVVPSRGWLETKGACQFARIPLVAEVPRSSGGTGLLSGMHRKDPYDSQSTRSRRRRPCHPHLHHSALRSSPRATSCAALWVRRRLESLPDAGGVGAKRSTATRKS